VSKVNSPTLPKDTLIIIIIKLSFSYISFTPTFILPPQGGGDKMVQSFYQGGGTRWVNPPSIGVGNEKRVYASLMGEEMRKELILTSRKRRRGGSILIS